MENLGAAQMPLRDFHQEAFSGSASSFDLVENAQLMQCSRNVGCGLREVFLQSAELSVRQGELRADVEQRPLSGCRTSSRWADDRVAATRPRQSRDAGPGPGIGMRMRAAYIPTVNTKSAAAMLSDTLESAWVAVPGRAVLSFCAATGRDVELCKRR